MMRTSFIYLVFLLVAFSQRAAKENNTNPLSTESNSKLMNSNLEFAATSKKVDIKQELTAATNKCSGVHISLIPFGNSGGVATSILSGKIGELNVPFES